MKISGQFPMEYVETPQHRLLVGTVTEAIKRGSHVCLRKIDGAYHLVIVEPSTSPMDPSTLGSFLPPDIVEQNCKIHAAWAAKAE